MWLPRNTDTDAAESEPQAQVTGAQRRRHLAQRLVRLLGSVTGFQIMYYAWFFASGLYGIFIAAGQPPVTLEGTMAHVSIRVWYLWNIFGPALSTAGMWLERTKFNKAGLWIQISGNVLFAFSLLAYITATFQVESWGRGMYGAFPLGTASLTSTACLILRDGLRIFLRRSVVE